MSVVVPSTSGGVRYDTSPLGLSPNWVTKHGGLPDFVRAVAHALIRDGHPESEAIQLAIGVIKRWASGRGNVTAKTRAKAAATVAHWELMKASTGRSDVEVLLELEFRATGAYAQGHKFEGNQWTTGPNAPVSNAVAGSQLGLTSAQTYLLATNLQEALGQKVTGQFTESQLAAVKSSLSSAAQTAAASGGSSGKSAASAAAAAVSKAQAAQAAADNQAAAAFKAAAAKQLADDKAASSPVSSSSLASANLINGLSAADRVTQSSTTPPAGFKWGSDSAGAPTLVPATPLAKAQVDTLTSNAATKAAAAAPTTLANGTTVTTAKSQALQASQVAASAKPATAASQKQANAINSMSPAARKSASATVPPAGFEWATDDQGNVSLVAAHRQAIGEFAITGPGQAVSVNTPDSSGAGTLLPTGRHEDHLPVVKKHKFQGMNLLVCDVCARPIADKIHTRLPASGVRSLDGSAVVSPVLPAAAASLLVTTRHTAIVDQDRVSAGFEKTMKAHFAAQRNSVLSRLRGKRGAQMVKAATANKLVPPIKGEKADTLKRAAEDPDNQFDGEVPDQPEAPAEPIPGANPAAVNPQAVFDDDFWTGQLIGALAPHYGVAAATAIGRVNQSAAVPAGTVVADSLAAVDSVLDQRANATAMKVTATTRKAIFQALTEGMANGEGIEQLAARINAIFDNADQVRAKMIAQTEAVGSLNQAAQQYASTLPTGIVGGKMWVAHHDSRTRPTHRLADGQVVNVSKPFWVGGFPMMHPGDQTAPPSETINCRCHTAYVPAGMATPIIGISGLEGLIPTTSIKALDKVLSTQAENRKTAIAAHDAAAAGSGKK